MLVRNRNSLDFATVLQLIISRNNRKLLLYYAKIMGDYHRVITMLLTDGRYDEALAVVQEAPYEKISNFIYKIMPSFFEHAPERTVNVILEKMSFQIPRLLPAILRYTTIYDQSHFSRSSASSDPNYALFCLEELFKRIGLHFENCPNVFETAMDANDSDMLSWVDLEQWVKSETEAITIHTTCYLYAKYDESTEEKKLRNFLLTLLQLQDSSALLELVEIDVEYMLRQCRNFQRRRGIVYCLLLLKDVKQATEEALLIDVELAKFSARRQSDPTLRKELWISIAIHLISIATDTKSVVSLVQESQEDIQIEVLNRSFLSRKLVDDFLFAS